MIDRAKKICSPHFQNLVRVCISIDSDRFPNVICSSHVPVLRSVLTWSLYRQLKNTCKKYLCAPYQSAGTDVTCILLDRQTPQNDCVCQPLNLN